MHIVLMIHCMDHLVDSTIARVCKILSAEVDTVRRIRSCCIVSKKNDKRRLTQMGPLPLERMLQSPLFNTGINHFGPLTIKGRSLGKVYGVMYNCFVSRDVYLEIRLD